MIHARQGNVRSTGVCGRPPAPTIGVGIDTGLARFAPMGTCIIWAGGSRGGTGVLGVTRLPGPTKGVKPATAGFDIGMLGLVGIIGVPRGAGSGICMRI
jgi:hypothetical protein